MTATPSAASKENKERSGMMLAGIIAGVVLFQALGSYIALQALIARGILENRDSSIWIVVFSSLFMAVALVLFVFYLWRTQKPNQSSQPTSLTRSG